MLQDRVILGIDPGTVIMGYGVIHVQGKTPKLLALGVIKLSKLDDMADRLKHIYDRTVGIIDQYKPDELAIEAPFFGKNVQSMLKLGRAQGVAIAAGLSRSVPMTEYSPKKIKQSLTGNGSASKEQVAAMLQHQFKFTELPKYLDATDALAAAICHFYQRNSVSSGKKSYSGWDAFVKDNAAKVKSASSNSKKKLVSK
ncbi:MAG TPA: crossover junction endodeoxyribonuclease RuvC [Flavobacteriales bacterium]|nr:crossover junction endodeoxyribonuclease RuvC [Flavobacteriales bacterium]